MAEAQDTPIQVSVVYLKIPEFGRRPVAEQARQRAQLDAALAVVFNELAPADRVLLDATDGVILLALRRPGAALRLAERVLGAVSAGLAVAIGINHGAVRFVDEAGQLGFCGDGIATAATVAELTSPSNLLVSRAFRDALADDEPAESAGLRKAGVFTDAGLRTHELYYPDRARATRMRKVFALVGTVAIVGVLFGSIAYRALADNRARPLAATVATMEQLLTKGEAAVRDQLRRIKR
jgi:hypothetical protein